MTTQIPPLHPATPPPLSKVEFYEYEIDEKDEFGGFLTVATDYGGISQTVLSQVTEEAQVASLIGGGAVGLPRDDFDYKSESSLSFCGDISNTEEKLKEPLTRNFSDEKELPWTNIVNSVDKVDWSSQFSNGAISNANEFTDVGVNSLKEKYGNCSDYEIKFSDLDADIEDLTNKIPNVKVEPEESFRELLDSTCIPEKAVKILTDICEIPLCTNLGKVSNAELNIDSGGNSETIVDESEFVVCVNVDESMDDAFQDFKTDGLQENSEDFCFDADIPCKEKKFNTSPPLPLLISRRSSNDVLRSSNFSEPVRDSDGAKEQPTTVQFDFITKDEVFPENDWISDPAITIGNCKKVETLNNSESTPFQFKSGDQVVEGDDEFSDFVSPFAYDSSNQSSNDVKSVTFDCVGNRDARTFDVDSDDIGAGSRLHINTCESWSEIFQSLDKDTVVMNLSTFEGKLNGSSIWCNLKNLETSPALNYNWQYSESNKVLLNTLSVDSRNILFGSRWNSEVPRFASNLGFNPLVPQKASSDNYGSYGWTLAVEEPVAKIPSNDTNLQVPETVNDAHFDWSDSGLTNPLDTRKYSMYVTQFIPAALGGVYLFETRSPEDFDLLLRELSLALKNNLFQTDSHSALLDLDLLANFDIHWPYYKKKRMSKSKELPVSELSNVCLKESLISNDSLSAEASEVLNNLPNLIVMEKQYIVFPIR